MTGESTPAIDHDHGHDNNETRLLRIARRMGATAGTFATWVAKASGKLPLAHDPDNISRRHPRG